MKAVPISKKTALGGLPLFMSGGAKMLPAFLEAAYRSWAEGQGRHVQAATTGELWKALTKVGFLADKAGGVRHREIPAIEQIRLAVRDALGEQDDPGDSRDG